MTATAVLLKGAVVGFAVAMCLEFMLVVGLVARVVWQMRSEKATGLGAVAGGLTEVAIMGLLLALLGALIGAGVAAIRRQQVSK